MEDIALAILREMIWNLEKNRMQTKRLSVSTSQVSFEGNETQKFIVGNCLLFRSCRLRP